MPGTNFEKDIKSLNVGEVDAGHIPTVVVEAGEDLSFGDRVILSGNKVTKVKEGKPDGIVNPFLEVNYKKNDNLILLVNPTLTSEAKHVWSFKDKGKKVLRRGESWVSDGDLCCPKVICGRCGAWDETDHCLNCYECKSCGNCSCGDSCC